MSARAVPFGKYFLLERINVGGMAEVYKAKMIGVEGFEKNLAIKRILPDIAADEDFIKMFIDEAKISVQLNHANIAQTFELGRLNDTYFIALEYVPGRDLRAVFERLRKRGEVVPPELACYIMSRVAEALDYAHRKKDAHGRDLGIIHRDISPQNILISYEGEVKIIDFGIAKAANKILKTQSGILKGKFGYMSPEQVRGLPLDRRSDLYALGICLYELLVGDRLFTGESDYSILEKVRTSNVPPPSRVRKGVPPALERIVTRALAREVEDRYPHASELVADLQRYLLGGERIFTREDLSAFMKTTFADEFEREKQSARGADELAVAPIPPTALSASVPQFRADSLAANARVRLEGGTAHAPNPPPPQADAFLPPPRPGRLRAALQAAETDKLGLDSDDEETTLPESEAHAHARRPSPPLDDEGTPTAETPLPLPIEVQPTRVGRAALPPPVLSRPPPPRAIPSAPPPRNLRMPAPITDHIPEPRGAPPPIDLADDDEPTQMDAPRAAPRPAVDRAAPPARSRAPEPGFDESTEVADRAPRLGPRRRRWELVPALVLVVMVLVLAAWRIAESRRARKGEEGVAPLPVPAATASAWGALVVETEPPDAEVWLDRERVKNGGETPFESTKIESGIAHALSARKEGFRDASESVLLAPGESRRVVLRLPSRNAVLTLRTIPPGATVLVDGRELAKTPETLGVLGPGTYAVRLELKCFEPVERQVTLGDAPQTLEVELFPRAGECVASPRPAAAEPGLLRLYSRPAAAVFVDGQPTGRQTPLLDFPVPAGRHRLRLVAGGRTQELDVLVSPGKSVTKVVVFR